MLPVGDVFTKTFPAPTSTPLFEELTISYFQEFRTILELGMFYGIWNNSDTVFLSSINHDQGEIPWLNPPIIRYCSQHHRTLSCQVQIRICWNLSVPCDWWRRVPKYLDSLKISLSRKAFIPTYCWYYDPYGERYILFLFICNRCGRYDLGELYPTIRRLWTPHSAYPVEQMNNIHITVNNSTEMMEHLDQWIQNLTELLLCNERIPHQRSYGTSQMIWTYFSKNAFVISSGKLRKRFKVQRQSANLALWRKRQYWSSCLRTHMRHRKWSLRKLGNQSELWSPWQKHCKRRIFLLVETENVMGCGKFNNKHEDW